MPTIVACARNRSSFPFASSRSGGFDEEDVTTVYDALLASDDMLLARALMGGKESATVSREFLASALAAAIAGRISALKRLALDIGPDWGSSVEEALTPQDPSGFIRIAGRSWPSVLGMRVALPKTMGRRARHEYIARILLCMSQV